MKKYSTLFLFFFLFSHYCFSQSVVSPYEVGTWQGFRPAAISYTFDDNTPNQLAVAVPMFDEFDFKLTLFTVMNWGPNWTGLQSAASNGHEIASHTVTHASLTNLSDTQQTTELKNSYETINSRITGQNCLTIAYPNCNVAKYDLVRPYYIAARGCQGFIEGKTPGDFMNISSIICGSQGPVKIASDFKDRADNAANQKGWAVYLVHAIDGDNGYSPLVSTELRASLEYLKENENKFWVQTFANVVKYIRERNALSVSDSVISGDSIIVFVTDTLDNSIYNYPVTIRRPVPENWDTLSITQNDTIIDYQIVNDDSVSYIMFDIIPDNGDVILVKNEVTGVYQDEISSPSSFNLYQNYPNPFNPVTKISYYVPESQSVEIKVFDLLGKEIATLVNEFKSTGLHTVEFRADNFTSGIYFYRLKTKDVTLVKKLALVQ
ncbi:MAG: polysaccharide deacetylase family protein [Ignavibacteriaceae bacterium]